MRLRGLEERRADGGGKGSGLGIVLSLHGFFLGLQMYLAKRNDAEYVFYANKRHLSFFSTITMEASDTKEAALCPEIASRQSDSQGSRGKS